MFDRPVQNVSLAPRLPYTEGDSSQKPRHDRRCHLSHDFAIEVRFSHVISLIYVDISESGNRNSQFGNPQALYVGFCNLCIFLVVVST